MTDPNAHIDTDDLPYLLAQIAVETVRVEGSQNRLKELRHQANDLALELRRRTGSQSFSVNVDGLGKVGTLSTPMSMDRAVVVDEKVFTAWVEQNHPDQIEFLTQVQPAFRDALLKNAKLDLTTGVVMHGKTKDIVEGLAVKRGGDPLTPSLRIDAKDKIREALAAGQHIGRVDATDLTNADRPETADKGSEGAAA